MITSTLIATALLALPLGAAEPVMRPAEALERLKSYQYGQDDRALHEVQAFVERAMGDDEQGENLAEWLGAILAEPGTTLAAKGFICLQLQKVRSKAVVPILRTMLDDPATAEMALAAIEFHPAGEALAALIDAAGRSKGPARVAAVHALGARREVEARGKLMDLLADPDPAVATAAAWAMRQTGGLEADSREILEKNWRLDRPLATRLEALVGLYRIREPAGRLDLLREALSSEAPILKLTALAIIGRDASAWRGVRGARAMATAFLDDPDQAVRLAAIATVGDLGRASSVPDLARVAAGAKGPPATAAFRCLAGLFGPGVDAAILEGAARGEPAIRAVLIRAAGQRAVDGAADLLVRLAADPEAVVRRSAIEALSVLAPVDRYPDLLRLLAGAREDDEEALRGAVLAAARGIADAPSKSRPALAALEEAQGAGKARILLLLAGIGGPEALQAVRGYLGSPGALGEAAFEALLAWPDASASPDLLAIARDAPDRERKSRALRGGLRLAQLAKDGPERAKAFEEIRGVAASAVLKKLLLECVAESANPAALCLAASFIGDREAGAEAAGATLEIAGALALSRPAEVREALDRLIAAGGDPALADRARQVIGETEKAPADPRVALVPDPARSAKRKAEIAARAPKGFHLASYLDCGPDETDGQPGGPALRVAAGEPHIWNGSERAAPVHFATILYHEQEVRFEATGLTPENNYRLGFSLWDYDANGRVESVWISTGSGDREKQALAGAELPGFLLGRSEAPREKVVAVPRDLYPDGQLRIAFRNERGPNAVVSEVWLFEKGGPAVSEPAPPPPPRIAKVLLLTGDDYPGHLWRQTAPVLAAGLRQDPRLLVTVVEKPEFLASPLLSTYDAIVLHWMNWEKPDPGAGARENLRRFVDGGKGLVVVHFACGAFQEWPEFRNLIGRSYDPKLPPHDPYGMFRVEPRSPRHPILKGLAPFDTTDELYTCLAGDAPIEVLAAARSKVDGKDYPMAFTRAYGKGRVFLSPLGHDVKALAVPAVAELFRRGAAWAADLPCAAAAPSAQKDAGGRIGEP
jgi:uncharacterized protein